jgi:hypothetical protein
MFGLDQSPRYACRSTSPPPPAPLPRSGFVLRPRFVVAYRFFVLGSRRSFSLAVSTSGGAGPLRGSIVGKPSYFEGMGIIPTATHTIQDASWHS